MSQNNSSRKLPETWVAVFATAVVCSIAFANSLGGAFVYDDLAGIHANTRILSPASAWDLLGGRRPVVDLTLALNHRIGGLDPTGYHLFNVVVHFLAALTLYGVVRRTMLVGVKGKGSRQATWLSLSIALIWCVHPLQTQAVSYVIQRCESLMGLFYLLAVYAFIRHVSGAVEYRWGVIVVVCVALGMGCKSVMATAPLTILAYDMLFHARTVQRALADRRWLYAALFSTWGLAFLFGDAQSVMTTTPAPTKAVGFGYRGITPWAYLLTQPGVILEYLRLSFWPDTLCLDYAWPAATSFSNQWWRVALVVAALGFTLLAFWKRRPWSFQGVWFFLILAPTSSIIPIRDPLVEHRLYLPLAAVVVAFVLILDFVRFTVVRRGWLPERASGAVSTIGVAVLLAVLTGRTMVRNRNYASSRSIWEDVVLKRPENARGRLNLGVELGDSRAAIRQFREAIRIRPDYADAWYNLGLRQALLGDQAGAVEAYQEAIHFDPMLASAHYNLGNTLSRLGRTDEAEKAYLAAIAVDANHAKAHFNLATLQYERGDLEGCLRSFRRARTLEPRLLQASVNVHRVLQGAGRVEEGVEELRIGLAACGDMIPARDRAQARFLMASSLASLGRFADSRQELKLALGLDPTHAESRKLLDSLDRRDQP